MWAVVAGAGGAGVVAMYLTRGHDDQIEAFAGVGGAGRFERPSIAQTVGRLERAGMAAAHPGQGGRVVARILLRRERRPRTAVAGRDVRRWIRNVGAGEPARTEHRTGDGDAHTVDEVPPGDGAIHAQLAIVFSGHRLAKLTGLISSSNQFVQKDRFVPEEWSLTETLIVSAQVANGRGGSCVAHDGTKGSVPRERVGWSRENGSREGWAER